MENNISASTGELVRGAWNVVAVENVTFWVVLLWLQMSTFLPPPFIAAHFDERSLSEAPYTLKSKPFIWILDETHKKKWFFIYMCFSFANIDIIITIADLSGVVI